MRPKKPEDGPAPASIPNTEMLFYPQTLTLDYAQGPDFCTRLFIRLALSRLFQLGSMIGLANISPIYTFRPNMVQGRNPVKSTRLAEMRA
jgi:hypothetical protein